MLTHIIEIKEVTHGSFHTNGKKLYAEGNNKYGSLGTGTSIQCNMIQIKEIHDVSNIAEIIEFDEFSTFILTKDGHLYISGKFNASNIFRKYNIRGIKNITHDCKYILTGDAVYELNSNRTAYNLLQVISNSITKIESCDNIMYILTRFGQLSFNNEILLNECIDICYNNGFLYVLTQNKVYMINVTKNEKPACYKLSDIHHINGYVCTPIKIHVIRGVLYIIYDDGIEIIDKDNHEFINISKDLKKYIYCNNDDLLICALLYNDYFAELYHSKDNVKDKKEQPIPKDIKCTEVKSRDITVCTLPMAIANVKHGTFYTDGKSLFATGDNINGCLGAGHHGKCHYTEIPIYDKTFNINNMESIYELDEHTTVIKMKNGSTLVTGKFNNSYVFKAYELSDVTKIKNDSMLKADAIESTNGEYNELDEALKNRLDTLVNKYDKDENILKLSIEYTKKLESNIIVYYNRIDSNNKHLFTFYNKLKDCSTSLIVNKDITHIIGYTDEYIAFTEKSENIIYIDIIKEEMYYLYKGNIKILDAIIAPDNCIVVLLDNNTLVSLSISDNVIPKSSVNDISNIDKENINITGDNYNIKLI